jgi:hypothetical protein
METWTWIFEDMKGEIEAWRHGYRRHGGMETWRWKYGNLDT